LLDLRRQAERRGRIEELRPSLARSERRGIGAIFGRRLDVVVVEPQPVEPRQPFGLHQVEAISRIAVKERGRGKGVARRTCWRPTSVSPNKP
jgi:hypothetical protein